MRHHRSHLLHPGAVRARRRGQQLEVEARHLQAIVTTPVRLLRSEMLLVKVMRHLRINSRRLALSTTLQDRTHLSIGLRIPIEELRGSSAEVAVSRDDPTECVLGDLE